MKSQRQAVRPMFNKILIANRGEIACRVAATARRMGIQTVAVYSHADAQARHVRACDEAVAIGSSPPAQSYLNADRILEAALATGAQAIHPGYGFLSENEDFAQACNQAGVVFIGPPASAIRDMGSKAAAKALMERAGVPLVPGYHGVDNDPQLLFRMAEEIGYPVLIKASAGGGGKGMRRVDSSQDFMAALASCQREAKASFGDDHVLVERYVQRPRHIEIQVFADHQGDAIFLFERDCSVQRRHQKILEEAPAPGMTAERRAHMGAAAVAAAKAVGYVGAGTVEFIAEQDGRFYFMEMNTRLQVEHPVTEAITGIDLVEWQLRVACGQPLPLRQDELQITGHAIEARVCAENPQANFLPATGRLHAVHWPAHVAFNHRSPDDPSRSAAVRVDTGFGQGDEISPFYDSMIAKLIVWGEDRHQALDRLQAALAQVHLVGLHTNAQFLRRTVQSNSFVKPDLDTALIERERDWLKGAPELDDLWASAGIAAHLVQSLGAQDHVDVFSKPSGWRLVGPARWRIDLMSGGDHRPVDILSYRGGTYALQYGDAELSWGFRQRTATCFEVTLGDKQQVLHVYGWDSRFTVLGMSGSKTLTLRAAGEAVSGKSLERGGLVAPMPGKVIAIMVEPGQKVRTGQALAVMEAMKMEHVIHAPHDGTVAELLHNVGDQVLEGAAIFRMEAGQ